MEKQLWKYAQITGLQMKVWNGFTRGKGMVNREKEEVVMRKKY